jgi:hypothetical protein
LPVQSAVPVGPWVVPELLQDSEDLARKHVGGGGEGAVEIRRGGGVGRGGGYGEQRRGRRGGDEQYTPDGPAG